MKTLQSDLRGVSFTYEAGKDLKFVEGYLYFTKLS